MPSLTFDTSAVNSFNDLFRQAQLGSPEALQTFFDKYRDAVLDVIRARMNRALRSAWDSADFMQRTRKKLLALKIDGKQLETLAALLAYINKIAQREVQQELRKRQNEKKASIDALSPAQEQQLVDRAPAVHDELAREETWHNILASFTPAHQAIAIRLREGYEHSEIAAERGVSERTVGRVAERLRELLIGEKEEES
jgi:RNA polymerase sigma factor (sigma-70 family)